MDWTCARHSFAGAYATINPDFVEGEFVGFVDACEGCGHRSAGCGFMSEVACGGWNICWLCSAA